MLFVLVSRVAFPVGTDNDVEDGKADPHNSKAPPEISKPFRKDMTDSFGFRIFCGFGFRDD